MNTARNRSCFEFEAIGTHWQIDVEGDGLSKQLQREVLALIDEYDRTFSRFRQDSLVTQIAKQSGAYVFGRHADEVFKLYDTLYRLTDGLFTPLVGQILEDLGYDASYSLMSKRPAHSPPAWPKVASYKHGVLTTKEPLLIDTGACGKGHLVDLVSAKLETQGITRYVVDAGSDMNVRRGPDSPLRIGLEHPFEEDVVVGVLELEHGSFCASSISRRAWGSGLHHVINPHTAAPTTHVAATWVLADTAMLADALATALFLVEPSVLAEHFSFEYVLLNMAMEADVSAGMKRVLFA